MTSNGWWTGTFISERFVLLRCCCFAPQFCIATMKDDYLGVIGND